MEGAELLHHPLHGGLSRRRHRGCLRRCQDEDHRQEAACHPPVPTVGQHLVPGPVVDESRLGVAGRDHVEAFLDLRRYGVAGPPRRASWLPPYSATARSDDRPPPTGPWPGRFVEFLSHPFRRRSPPRRPPPGWWIVGLSKQNCKAFWTIYLPY